MIGEYKLGYDGFYMLVSNTDKYLSPIEEYMKLTCDTDLPTI